MLTTETSTKTQKSKILVYYIHILSDLDNKIETRDMKIQVDDLNDLAVSTVDVTEISGSILGRANLINEV